MKIWIYPLIGFVLVASLAVFMTILTFDLNAREGVIEIFFTLFICSATWGGCMAVNRFICARLMTRNEASVKRLLMTYLISGLYAIALIVLSFKAREWLDPSTDIPAQNYAIYSVFSLLITLLVISNYTISDFMNQWKQSELKAEHMKQQMLKSEYESLKNQVNPHFLFNSLNTLTALIGEDQEKATDFVQKLSKVFRYALQNQEKNTIDLGSEIEIVNSYLFLQKMRFGDNLQFHVDVPAAINGSQVITQGLLTLVENAIKHNEASIENPLLIDISLQGKEYVVIKNNLQRKNMTQPSTGIGLPNIISRCQSLTSRQVIIKEEKSEFIVMLPIIYS